MNDERDQSVIEYLDYTRERASWWAAKYPHLSDDIHSTAMVALVQGFTARVPEQPKGYISACVDNAIKDMLGNNYLIHVPKSEIKRRKEAKESLDTLPRAIILDDEDLWNLKRSHQPPVWMDAYIRDVYRLLELDKREERILFLKSEGYTNEEVGLEFSITEAAIRKTLKQIKGRYLTLLRTHHELLRPYEEA